MSFEQFDSFGADYQPMTGFAPDVKSLPLARVMQFEVIRAELKRPKGDDLCEMTVKCLTPGLEGEYRHTWWLNTTGSFNMFAGDMLKLGFDADKWNTPNRPLSAEVPRAVARLAGIAFNGMNETSTDKKTGKEYVNFRVLRKTGATATAPAASAPANHAAASTQEEESIPF